MVTEKKRKSTRHKEPQFIVDSKGRPKAVILSLEEWEDLQDLASIEARKNEPSIPWEEVKARLIADGLLQD